MATAYFIRHGAAQYADVPLGFYILATLVLLTLQDEAPETSYSVVWLSGLTVGFAAWTKNEGLLFVVCLVVARSLVAILRKSHRTGFAREARAFLLALAPVLLILLYFKIQWASPNSLMTGHRNSVLDLRFTARKYRVSLSLDSIYGTPEESVQR